MNHSIRVHNMLAGYWRHITTIEISDEMFTRIGRPEEEKNLCTRGLSAQYVCRERKRLR